MASYRPFPPAPPNQNTLQPTPPPAAQPRGSQWGYGSNDGYSQMHPSASYQHAGYGPASQQHYSGRPPQQRNQVPAPPPPSQQQQYPYPPPPPRPQPVLPAPMYYPSSQYTQHQPLQPAQPPPPPPPPSSPPPSSAIPPPPPPSSPPPPPPSLPSANQSNESRLAAEKVPSKDGRDSGWRDSGNGNQGVSSKQHKPPAPHVQAQKVNAHPGRVETEEERRLRKKREFEKQRQEEKHRQNIKESQNRVLQKTQIVAPGMKDRGPISASLMADRKTTPLLSGERIENRLKKPTTFLCKLKFRNELPDPSAQPKLMSLSRDKDLFTKYTITSLEKMHKPQLYVEPDLGIPLDLLDLSVYNPPNGVKLPLDPEDEVLLHDDDPVTPIKKNGIKRKERPTDKGVSWLVKTQYISPLSMESTKQSLTEKQAKELRETRGGQNILENLNNRERQIQEIEASFEACKLRPVHATNPKLRPVKILPLFPNFDRYKDQFVVANFDSAPTADAENYSKLDKDVRDAHESRAIMKSFAARSSDASKSDKFLAYMVPSPEELEKDMFDENEDISYTWVREYHWDARGDDADDPTTYVFTLGDSAASYVPLPTKLSLRKKRAREGKPSDETDHFPVPSKVTARWRPTAAAVELKDEEDYSSLKGSVSNSKRARIEREDILQSEKDVNYSDQDQSSGGEYDDLSD